MQFSLHVDRAADKVTYGLDEYRSDTDRRIVFKFSRFRALAFCWRTYHGGFKNRKFLLALDR